MDDWRDLAKINPKGSNCDVLVMKPLKAGTVCVKCKEQLDYGEQITSTPTVLKGKLILQYHHMECPLEIDDIDEQEIVVIESLNSGTRCTTCKKQFIDRELIESRPMTLNEVPVIFHRHVKCPSNSGENTVNILP